MEPRKRITMSEILAHGLMREVKCGKSPTESSNSTTTTTTIEDEEDEEDEEESVLEWEYARVLFVQRIVETIVGCNLLTFWMTTAFKFYINKALLYFLNRAEIKILREGGN